MQLEQSGPRDEATEGRQVGFSLRGLVAHGKEVRFHPVGHKEPLKGPEVVCICKMPQAAMDRQKPDIGREASLQSSCET